MSDSFISQHCGKKHMIHSRPLTGGKDGTLGQQRTPKNLPPPLPSILSHSSAPDANVARYERVGVDWETVAREDVRMLKEWALASAVQIKQPSSGPVCIFVSWNKVWSPCRHCQTKWTGTCRSNRRMLFRRFGVIVLFSWRSCCCCFHSQDATRVFVYPWANPIERRYAVIATQANNTIYTLQDK